MCEINVNESCIFDLLNFNFCHLITCCRALFAFCLGKWEYADKEVGSGNIFAQDNSGFIR